MVVTPEECLKLNRIDHERVAKSVSDIDNMLRNSFNGNPITYRMEMRDNSRRDLVLIELARLYTEAGWTFTIQSGTDICVVINMASKEKIDIPQVLLANSTTGSRAAKVAGAENAPRVSNQRNRERL